MQLDIHAIKQIQKLKKWTASIAHVISEKLSRNAPKGAKKSQQESITQVNKNNELKTEKMNKNNVNISWIIKIVIAIASSLLGLLGTQQNETQN